MQALSCSEMAVTASLHSVTNLKLESRASPLYKNLKSVEVQVSPFFRCFLSFAGNMVSPFSSVSISVWIQWPLFTAKVYTGFWTSYFSLLLTAAQVRTVVIIGLVNILNSALQIAVQKTGVWKASRITKISTLKKPSVLSVWQRTDQVDWSDTGRWSWMLLVCNPTWDCQLWRPSAPPTSIPYATFFPSTFQLPRPFSASVVIRW
jgi:hypothetical protein